MRDVLWLAWRAVWARPLVSLLLVLCVSVSVALPLASSVLIDRFEASLRSRAEATPIVVGPDVSRFDLVFSALYFRAADMRPIDTELADNAQQPGLTVLPLRLSATVRGRQLVGTDDRYHEHRDLRPASGELPFQLGDVALGARSARAIGLSVGDTIVSDPPEGLDLAASSPVELTIVGILEPTGTPDDDALFCTLPTAWLAEGILHGHQEATEVEGTQNVIGRTGEHVALTDAVETARSVTDENRASFHFHANPDRLPLTAFIVVPETDKDETIALARLDALPGVRALRSIEVVEELLETVLGVKAALDIIALLFIATTSALLVLIFWLTARLRTNETRTIRDIGAARWTVPSLFACEGAMILLAGSVGGALLTLLTIAIAERVVPWF